jgi:hypothetical protein
MQPSCTARKNRHENSCKKRSWVAGSGCWVKVFHQKQGKAAAVRPTSALAPGLNASAITRISSPERHQSREINLCNAAEQPLPAAARVHGRLAAGIVDRHPEPHQAFLRLWFQSGKGFAVEGQAMWHFP